MFKSIKYSSVPTAFPVGPLWPKFPGASNLDFLRLVVTGAAFSATC